MDIKELFNRANSAKELCRPTPPNHAGPQIEYVKAAALESLIELINAVNTLSNPAILDSTRYRIAQIERKIAASEYNASSIKLDLYGIKERCAELMSQHEPVASIGIDREQLRQALQFVLTGRLK